MASAVGARAIATHERAPLRRGYRDMLGCRTPAACLRSCRSASQPGLQVLASSLASAPKAGRPELQPSPAITAFTTDENFECLCGSSRAWMFEMCTSKTGPSKVLMASNMAIDVNEYAAGLMMI